MSAAFAIAEPRRIKATHRRRRKIAAGHFVQRYYDPQIGRFLSVDPVAANPNTGSSFNRYSYADDNPYRFTDPDGRASKRTDAETDAMNDPNRPTGCGTMRDCTRDSTGTWRTNSNGSLPNTAAERKMLSNGDAVGYYQSRASRGDSYAPLALAVVNNSFSTDQAFESTLGIVANYWLSQNIGAAKIRANASNHVTGGLSAAQFSRKVNIDLARAHARAVDVDRVGRRGQLSAGQIASYHESYFQSLGLPVSTFGGSALGFQTSYWCPACD